MAAAAAALVIAAAAYFVARPKFRGIDSIAVLPLTNDAKAPDLDYLCDGVTESVTNKLSQIPGLRVMARSTVFHFKGKESDPRSVGRELGVRAVLTGHIVQRGDIMTISVELTNVQDGSLIWGEQYNRKFTDVFRALERLPPRSRPP